jgi:hypothetical protein
VMNSRRLTSTPMVRTGDQHGASYHS